MSDIDVLLEETRSFPPPAEFSRSAHVNTSALHDAAAADYERFWAEMAGQLEWSRPWDTVLEWTPPHARWFTGGELNASVNCVMELYPYIPYSRKWKCVTPSPIRRAE